MTLDDLFATARTGDPKAREALAGALYDLLWPRFRRSFSGMEAEDLVQSTMVLIFRRIERDRDRDPPRSFEQVVLVTAGRVMLMARRSWARERGRRVDDPPNLVAPDTSLSQRQDRHDRVGSIIAAVDELETAEQRALFGWATEVDWRQQTEREGRCAPASVEHSRGCEAASIEQIQCGPVWNRPPRDGRKRAENILRRSATDHPGPAATQRMARAALPISERESLLLAIRSHPEWTLAQLAKLATKAKSGKLLSHVRVRDLWIVDPELLAAAERLRGLEFDACVLKVIRKARTSVNAGYLRAHVGGPRWKLQAALGRLTEARVIKRSGTTGSTRYELVRSRGKPTPRPIDVAH